MPLQVGDRGESVADLQRRLAAQHVPVAVDLEGEFASGTRAAVEEFQHRRGLRVDGVCGRETWNALVEAGFRVGDRFLYLRSPMVRGDDVAEVQRRLSALGFDTGRVDGIFGPLTSAALREFQRNTGLAVDGILGAGTLRELKRVTPRHAEPDLVATVRDREQLRQAPRTLAGRRVAIGEEGGLDVVVTAIRRALTASGAQVVPLLHPSGSVQASAANAAGADVFVGLRVDADHHCCTAAYYSGYSYESLGGRRLAERISAGAAEALGTADHEVRGMSLPILRETKMPAVLCDIGPASLVVLRSAQLARALAHAVTDWVATPVD